MTSPVDEELKALAESGEAALADLFSGYRSRLERIVRFRIDARLRARLDPSDVLQEAYLKVSRRIHEFRAAPDVSLFVWIRRITFQTLIDLQRGVLSQKRDPRREASRRASPAADETSLSIVRALAGELTSPSGAALRRERIDRLHDALRAMDETDREVLALRHFEQLGNREVAEILDVSETAASNRYVRALARLGDVLAECPEFEDIE